MLRPTHPCKTKVFIHSLRETGVVTGVSYCPPLYTVVTDDGRTLTGLLHDDITPAANVTVLAPPMSRAEFDALFFQTTTEETPA